MWRGIVSIIALLLMGGSAIIITTLLVIPSMGFHILVPVLQPLHQALACEAGETLNYEYEFFDNTTTVHFRCVNAAGSARDVDPVLRTPANYAIGVFCLGGLLLLVPFFFALRQGTMKEAESAVGQALQQGIEEMQAMTQSQSSLTTLTSSGQQQLDALEKLRQQGHITQEAYEIAKKRIFDIFSAS
ncbi:MAG: hypothetical protein MUF87_10765 [Anaerolineae bacterium]|jgi:hypothetical protein|nr:hypothetical protein [Anaerolineae bacterium]